MDLALRAQADLLRCLAGRALADLWRWHSVPRGEGFGQPVEVACSVPRLEGFGLPVKVACSVPRFEGFGLPLEVACIDASLF